MALLQLRLEGDPILRKKSKEVKEINDRVRLLLDDMLETMYEDKGIGLAAPQVGRLRRLITVDVGEGAYKMINPEIIERSDEEEISIEGCLSVPHFNGTVYRPKNLKLKYLDVDGKEQIIEARGLFARCICHEIDHLDGILFRDKVDHPVDMENPDQETRDYLREKGIMIFEEDQAGDRSGETDKSDEADNKGQESVTGGEDK